MEFPEDLKGQLDELFVAGALRRQKELEALLGSSDPSARVRLTALQLEDQPNVSVQTLQVGVSLLTVLRCGGVEAALEHAVDLQRSSRMLEQFKGAWNEAISTYGLNSAGEALMATRLHALQFPSPWTVFGGDVGLQAVTGLLRLLALFVEYAEAAGLDVESFCHGARAVDRPGVTFFGEEKGRPGEWHPHRHVHSEECLFDG